MGPDHFFTVYSHSLATCGVVQFGLTVLVVFFVQGTSSAGNEYGSLLVIFGSIMATAALPIFVIMIGNAYFPTAQEKGRSSPGRASRDTRPRCILMDGRISYRCRISDGRKAPQGRKRRRECGPVLRVDVHLHPELRF